MFADSSRAVLGPCCGPRAAAGLRCASAVLLCGLSAVGQVVPGPTLPNFERRSPVVLAVENVGPAVVNISTHQQVRRSHLWLELFRLPNGDDPDAGSMLEEASQGSGVIVHEDGYVVTNEHVIFGADKVLVRRAGHAESLAAEIVNVNSDSDLAVLRLDPAGAPYPLVQFADSAALHVGETTIALGNPFGLESSVTTGILSGTGRKVTLRGRDVYTDFLQTSALINPGNSGGALLDVNGRLIGINVAIDTRGPGIGYAIPVNRVREITATLMEPELSRDAWIGIDVRDDRDGVLVQSVVANSPAARAKLIVGSRVLRVDGIPIGHAIGFNAILSRHRPDSVVTLTLRSPDGTQSEASIRFEAVDYPRLVDGRALRAHGLVCVELDPRLAVRLGVPTDLQAVVAVAVDPDSPAGRIDVRVGDLIYQLGVFKVADLARFGRVLGYYGRRGSAPIWLYRQNERFQGRMQLAPVR